MIESPMLVGLDCSVCAVCSVLLANYAWSKLLKSPWFGAAANLGTGRHTECVVLPGTVSHQYQQHKYSADMLKRIDLAFLDGIFGDLGDLAVWLLHKPLLLDVVESRSP